MIKYVVAVDGMQCGMCEAHVNDAVRQTFPVEKVRSSHTKKETVVVTDREIDPQRLKEEIDKTGYTVLSVKSEVYEKK